MKSNTRAPNYHPECQLISGAAPPDEPREEPGARKTGAHQRLGSQRWAHEHKGGPRAKTHRCSCAGPAAPQLKGPGLWGSYNSTWPSHSIQDWGTLKGI